MSRMADVYYELTEAIIAWETKRDKQPLEDFKARYGADIYDADVYDRILIENNL